MADQTHRTDDGHAPGSDTPAPTRRAGARGADVRDAVAEMTVRAHEISQDAGARMTTALRDVINAAAGLAGFAVESARDLVQFMVRRGQMSASEAEQLLRDAEAAHARQVKANPPAARPAATEPAKAGTRSAAKGATSATTKAPARTPAKAPARKAAPAKAETTKGGARPAKAAAPAKVAPAKAAPKTASKAAAKTAKATRAPSAKAGAKGAAKPAKATSKATAKAAPKKAVRRK